MYYTRQSEYVFARAKLREAESAKIKAEKEGSNKKGNEKRMKNLDRIKEKVGFDLMHKVNNYVFC